ncbi:MAG: sulfite exporter TauE/SafE family protein [Rhodobacterales bacterium]|nr:sulfite exporter TauE/SafE family protein [Rhodobacterales bacterium]
MHDILAGLPLWALIAAAAISAGAGLVKGATGFAMPLIMVSTFGAIMPPETALAALILPVLVTNVAQALRQGWRAAWGSIRTYRRLIGAILVFIPVSAQFVRDIPQPVLLMLLGVPVTAFAAVQLAGRSLALTLRHRNAAEYALGAVGGLYGGVSGIWGPPVLVFLLSVHAGKQETVRVQGVVFFLGAVMLTAAHLGSGVLNATTLPLSALLVLPAAAGMWLGYRIQDRLDPVRFRRWTLVLLLLTGGNLIRRALT